MFIKIEQADQTKDRNEAQDWRIKLTDGPYGGSGITRTVHGTRKDAEDASKSIWRFFDGMKIKHIEKPDILPTYTPEQITDEMKFELLEKYFEMHNPDTSEERKTALEFTFGALFHRHLKNMTFGEAEGLIKKFA